MQISEGEKISLSDDEDFAGSVRRIYIDGDLSLFAESHDTRSTI